MAADISGPGGSFTGPSGFNMHFSGWSATLNPTTVETTGFAEVGNRTYDVTAIVVTGTADGTIQNGNSTTPVAASGLSSSPTMSAYGGTVTLTFASGNTWAFPSKITGLAINRRHDGKADGALSFVSSGAITQTWA